ncbi:ABC-2 type transport system permease protein [Kineosphaera limosa]|uniref:Transport permease protein n=1 Tax=Kineosphaera limosa NBRC 100340 TaxID=1184609 RepID=K6W6T8_9MICO|nr:ABC transporter permease [Kineosphaera limosa]NYE00899.1 ABC-2 type transport system permease protein [Kineosphaera limosa]GAB94905.1 putative ABC transporter permease protein [Kineosphaera limosa NBRC 100340]
MSTTDLTTTPAPAPETPAPVRRGLFADIGSVWMRETLTILRDPFSLIFSLLQPLVFLGLFAPLLAGMSGEGGPATLQWFLPGVVVMITMFGTSMTGSNLQFEIMTGAFERILATPLRRSALLVGRALKELTPLLVQALVIVLVAWPFGFALHPAHIAVGLVIIGVFGVGVGALSYALAIAARKAEWIFWAVQQTLLFPLLILSGMMLPLETGPRWMQVAAQFNPLTHIVDALRVLFAGGFDITVGYGALAAVLTCAVGLTVGVRSITRTVL